MSLVAQHFSVITIIYMVWEINSHEVTCTAFYQLMSVLVDSM